MITQTVDAVEQPTPTKPQSAQSSFCFRMAKKTLNFALNLGLGVATSVVVNPVMHLSEKALIRLGVFNDSWNDMLRLILSTINGPFTFDLETALAHECPFQEIVRQHNHFFSNGSLQDRHVRPINADSVKSLITTVFILTAAIEELVFRGAVQDLLLTRIPKAILQKLAPDKVSTVDGRIAKVAKIALVATLFASSHLLNMGKTTDSYVSGQVIQTVILGIVLGIIKESRLGLAGAIGLHGAFNAQPIGALLEYQC